MRLAFVMAAAVLAGALAAAPARAQFAPGDSLAALGQPLPAVDGRSASLAAEAGPQGLVVVFWSNTCPWGDRYAGRVAELAAAYRPAGFGFALVNSHAPDRLEAESAEAGRDELAAAGLVLPYLLDADGAVARALGARSAPHAFVFDGAGRLAYDGAIDDSPSSASRVERPYLREALDRIVAGLPVEIQKTQPFGCRRPSDAPATPATPAPAP